MVVCVCVGGGGGGGRGYKKNKGFLSGSGKKIKTLELKELNHEKRLLGCCSFLNDDSDLHKLWFSKVRLLPELHFFPVSYKINSYYLW